MLSTLLKALSKSVESPPRALRKLVKRVAEDPEALSKTTLTRYIQPMATRCLFNPTFRAASELVAVCISANAAICRTLGVSAYLKQLDRFIQVEVRPAGDKALARQKFNLIAAILDRYV